MSDVLCYLMGGLDVLVGIILLFSFSNFFFISLGIAMIIKGGMSFLG
jgi:hypothetical protein